MLTGGKATGGAVANFICRGRAGLPADEPPEAAAAAAAPAAAAAAATES